MDAAVPYLALAPDYNRVMSHVDYPGWARYLRAAWRKYHGVKPPERVLEIAAGTCPFASLTLFPKAFTVYTDRSPAMLSVGARHASPLQEPPLLRVACDARALALRGPFDLAIMIYDSLNYLLQPEDVICALREVRQALHPKGLFIFDVATETCSRRYFSDSIDFEELDGCASVRASRYDARRRVQLNLFTLFVAGADGRYDRREEVHRQRIHRIAALRKLARRAGFSVRACLADFTFKPGSERNERIHFVLQRP
jgi:SAM-dependent methyltransferase